MIIDDHCDDNYDKEEDDFILPWPAASAPPCPYKRHPPLRTDNTHPGHYLTSNPHSALHILREKKCSAVLNLRKSAVVNAVLILPSLYCAQSLEPFAFHCKVSTNKTHPGDYLPLCVLCCHPMPWIIHGVQCAMHLIEDWQHPSHSFSASTLGIWVL